MSPALLSVVANKHSQAMCTKPTYAINKIGKRLFFKVDAKFNGTNYTWLVIVVWYVYIVPLVAIA